MRVVVLGVLAALALLVLFLWAGQDEAPREGVSRPESRPDVTEAPIEVDPGLVGREPRPGAEKAAAEPVVRESTPEPTPAAPVVTRYVLEGLVRDRATGDLVPVPIRVSASVYEDQGGGAFSARTIEIGIETERSGRFRLETDTAKLPYPTQIVSASPDWYVFAWALGGAPASRVDVTEGAVNQVVVEVLRAFRLRGHVLDTDGNPLPKAHIQFPVLREILPGQMNIGSTHAFTDEFGAFDIGPFPFDQSVGLSADQAPLLDAMGRLLFDTEGLPPVQLDPWAIPEAERDRLEVRLHPGFVLAGIVVDEAGRPLVDVAVAAEYGVWDKRRGARTDASGAFRLDQLAPGHLVLRTRAFAFDAKGELEIDLQESDENVRLVAKSIALSDPVVAHEVLGLGLADVTDEMRAAYDVPDHVKVLILDPGDDPNALGIGRLERGYGLWMVGETPVESARHAVEVLLVEPPPKRGVNPAHARFFRGRRRIVYTFWNERMSGSNTQHLTLTDEQRAALTELKDRLR